MMAGMSMCKDVSDISELYLPNGLFLKPIIEIEILVMFPSLKVPGLTISNWEIMEKLKLIILPEKFNTLKVSKMLTGKSIDTIPLTKFMQTSHSINNYKENYNPNEYEFLLLEAELDNQKLAPIVVDLLNGKHSVDLIKNGQNRNKHSHKHKYSIIKLSGLASPLKVRASYTYSMTKLNSKTQDIASLKEQWVSHFNSDKLFINLKPGYRPDTILLTNLPCKWFSQSSGLISNVLKDIQEIPKPLITHNKNTLYIPDEQILFQIFSKYGPVRAIDLPLLDQFCKDGTNAGNKWGHENLSLSSFQSAHISQPLTFDVYIQYKDYQGFERAMTSLTGSKLLFNPSEMPKGSSNFYTASFTCDFDRTRHMSDSAIRKRAKLRESLVFSVGEVQCSAPTLIQSQATLEPKQPDLSTVPTHDPKNRVSQIKRSEETTNTLTHTNCPTPEQESSSSKRLSSHSKDPSKRHKKVSAQLMAQEKVLIEERKLILTQRKLESKRMLSYLFAVINESVETKAREAKMATNKERTRVKHLKRAKRKEAKLQERLILEEHRLRQKLLRKMRTNMKKSLQQL